MWNKKISICSIFCIVCILTVSGQQKLTLEQCREFALANNKQTAIANKNVEKTGADVKAYRANYLPRFSATGNYLYTSSSINKTLPGTYLPTFIPDGSGQLIPNILTTQNGIPLFKEYAYFPDMDIDLKLSGTYTAGVSIEQPIYTGGKITAAYRMSKTGEQIAGLNKELTRTEVILMTDEGFWVYVQAQELVKTAESYFNLISVLLKDVENAYNAGLKPRNDLLKVQVKLNEGELMVMQAKNTLKLSKMNLCHIIGFSLYAEIEVEENTEAYSDIENYKADITSRPEYIMLTKQIELKNEQTKLVRSEFLPNIGVMGNFGYANGLKINGNKLLNRTSFSAVLSVSIPLFHWGEGRNKVKSIRIEKSIVSLQRDDLSEKMELELNQSLSKLEESRMEVQLTTRSLKQAEENMKVSRDHYDAGMETISDHLEAQALWQKAYSDLIRAKTSARLSETRYLKAAGRL